MGLRCELLGHSWSWVWDEHSPHLAPDGATLIHAFTCDACRECFYVPEPLVLMEQRLQAYRWSARGDRVFEVFGSFDPTYQPPKPPRRATPAPSMFMDNVHARFQTIYENSLAGRPDKLTDEQSAEIDRLHPSPRNPLYGKIP
jgi:hypothetical protein